MQSHAVELDLRPNCLFGLRNLNQKRSLQTNVKSRLQPEEYKLVWLNCHT